MSEKLIIKGNTHTLVDPARNEAMSFSAYGDMVGTVDAKSVMLLSYGNTQDVSLLSFVSTGTLSMLDVMFKDMHCLIKLDKPMVRFVSELRLKLDLASAIPYRVKHDTNKVVHTIYALKRTTTIEYISKILDTPKEMWEPVFKAN